MSAMAKKARSEMRAKANRLGNSKSPGKVDASSWSPGEPLNADKKTGARPIRPRIYKFGGAVQGDRAPKNAGKEPRNGTGPLSMTDVRKENKDAEGSFHTGGYKKGGRTEKCGGGSMNKGGRAEKANGGSSERMVPLTARQRQIAADVKASTAKTSRRPPKGRPAAPPAEAPVELGAPGTNMDDRSRLRGLLGGSAKGGKVDKAKGGEVDKDEKQDKAAIKGAIHKHDKQMHGGKLTKGLKHGGDADSAGGRVERAAGGRTKSARTKGKTNINIIIGAPGGQQQPNMPPPQAPVRPPPPPQNVAPPPMGPPGGGPPMMPSPGPPPGGPPDMPPGIPPGMPPGGPPGMPRARGGRAYMSLKAGGGSGVGRLQKAHSA